MRDAVGFGFENALILSLDDLYYRCGSPDPIERESWGMSARQLGESANDAPLRSSGFDRHRGNFGKSRDDRCRISARGAVNLAHNDASDHLIA
jgi:hypothetical protein